MSERPDNFLSTINFLWQRYRFYIVIITATAALLAIIIAVNKAQYIPENLIPAGLSLCNAVIAYVVSKKKQGKRTYKEMMRTLFAWTAGRFIVMIAALLIFVLTAAVEPLPFIFSFIGFYIMHQLIEIGIMKLETR